MTKNELDKIKKYLQDNDFTNRFGMFCRLYDMTTENIFGFLNKYDLKDKNILTVAGSGDQRLNSYLLGASEVTCFDINPLTELHIELKDKAIEILSYEEFLDFFGILDKDSLLDFRIFDKLSILLGNDTHDFYNYVIQNRKTKDIYFDTDDLDTLNKLNGYFNEKNYLSLRNIIKNKKINFIDSDIYNLPEKLDGRKFDMILLSNISDYTHHIFEGDDLKEYRELIDRLMNNLENNGILQVGYIYSMYDRGGDISKFHLNKYRNIYFPNDMFHVNFVSSYYNDGSYDKIVTYQKIK